MTNPDYPGSFKIGMTTKTPDERAKQLSSETGVRSPFSVFCYNMSPCADVHERAAHLILDQYRESQSKEFFRAPPDVVIRTFDEMAEAIRFSRWWRPGVKTDEPALNTLVPPMCESDLVTAKARKRFRKAEELELNEDGSCPMTVMQHGSPHLSANVRYPTEMRHSGTFFRKSLRTADPEEALEGVRLVLKCMAKDLDNYLITKGIEHE